VARDPKLLSPLLGNSLAVSFFFGTLCALLVGVFFYFFPELSPIQGTLLYLGLLWTPFGLAYLLLQNLLLGIHQVRSYNKIELGAKIFYVSLIGVVILMGWVSPMTIFLGAFIGLGFSLIWAYSRLRSIMEQKPSISLPQLNKSMHYGIKSYFGSLFAFLLFRIDLLMINYMLGPKETGLYDIAVNLAEMVYLVSDVVATMLFPKLCSIKEIPEKWKTAKNIGLWLIVTMSGICVLAGLMAYPTIKLLYGDPFLPSVQPFLILILCKLLLSVNTIFSNFVGSIHVPWTSIPYTFSLVILNIILNLIFINQFGIVGAAWASTISFGLLIPFNSFYSFKYLRSPDFQTS
jgi:O-antigen/teichoic acid export membrane protein